MRLLVISYKVCWFSEQEADYVTFGGFPFQMSAISELFDSTEILLLERQPPIPSGSIKIIGNNIQINTFPEPVSHDLMRKLALIAWLPRNFLKIWKKVAQADAVHSPLPGDLGTIGMLIALLQKKPLFIRHCGRWGIPSSPFDRLLQRFLEKIAGSRNVVMATGGAAVPPSVKNPAISWIFSTALTASEIAHIPVAHPWQPDQPLRLVTVGSLLPGKNLASLLDALPDLLKIYPWLTLEIIGTGRLLNDLKQQARDLALESRVIFSGNLSHDQVLVHLSQSHVFVFPTLYEGFPKALLEAMSCGLPIVANPVSVIPVLLEGDVGLLLDGSDSSAIENALHQLLSDPQKMATMGQLSRERAKVYTLERWRDEIGQRLEAAWGQPLKRQPGESD